MSALERLYAALEPLRLYSLHNDSLIDKELAAYAAGFAILEERFADIHRRAFVQTSTGEDLTALEKLTGLPLRTTQNAEDRRAAVLYRMGHARQERTLEGMYRSIRAMGIEVQMLPDIHNESIEVHFIALHDSFLDLDRVKSDVARILPAHLEIVFAISELTFDSFDELDINWMDWDSIDFTWTEFDINGQNILKGR